MKKLGLCVVIGLAGSVCCADIISDRTAAEQARGKGKRGWIAWEAERNQFFPAQNLARVKEIASYLPAKAIAPGDPTMYRAEWNALAATPDGKRRIKEAEKALGEPVPTMPADVYEQYQKTGNRGVYEAPNGKIMRGLQRLVYGEALEGKGRFIAKIAAYLEVICNKPSWIAPYEGGASDRNKPLDGIHYIDLGASHTALIVATTVSWFRAQLPEKTRARALEVLRGRIFKTFLADSRRKGETKPYYNWWMPDRFNWSAVCHNGCTSAILAVEDDPMVRAEAIESSERLMVPSFLDGFLADGYCEEGIGYWNYGFGDFMMFAANVRIATGGKVDFCRDFPRARLVATFGTKYKLSERTSPPFADGNGTPEAQRLSFINAVWPDLYAAETAGLSPLRSDFWVDGMRSFGPFKIVPGKSSKPNLLPIRDWFACAETLICRAEPFAFAIKAGSNGDRHNHNDAGSYIISLGNRFFAGDPGSENYNRRTFSRQRYESPVLNSYAHPVPKVGGELQGTGPAFGAKMLNATFSDACDVIVMDLASAYPAKVPIVRLVRTATFDRLAKTLTVTDDVTFDRPTAFESPVISYFKAVPVKPDLSHLRIEDGKSANSLDVTLRAEGGEWSVSEEKISNPARTDPYRYALSFKQPVKKAKTTVVYKFNEKK